MQQHNPVMSGKRLKTEGRVARLEPSSRKNNGPRRGSTGAVGVVGVEGIDPDLKRGPGNRSKAFWKPPDQYRATMTMTATSNAAISESARSRAFECGFAGVASRGGMTQFSMFNCAPDLLVLPPPRTLRRRLQLTGKPAARHGCHGVVRYRHCLNATALLALECAVVEAGRFRFEFRQQHAILLAPRAARPFDGGNTR
jgi:hypothetical protein